MHDVLLGHQGELRAGGLSGYAAQLGSMPSASWRSCGGVRTRGAISDRCRQRR